MKNKIKYIIYLSVSLLILFFLTDNFLKKEIAINEVKQKSIFLSKTINYMLYQDETFTKQKTKTTIITKNTSVKIFTLLNDIYNKTKNKYNVKIVKNFVTLFDSQVYEKTKKINQAMNRSNYTQKKYYDIQVRLKRYFYNNQRILKYKPDFITKFKKKPFNEVEVKLDENKFSLAMPIYHNFEKKNIKENNTDNAKKMKVFSGIILISTDYKAYSTCYISYAILLLGFLATLFTFNFFFNKEAKIKTDITEIKLSNLNYTLITFISIIFFIFSIILSGSKYNSNSFDNYEKLSSQLKSTSAMNLSKDISKNRIPSYNIISFNEFNLPQSIFSSSGYLASEFKDSRYYKNIQFALIIGIFLFLIYFFLYKGLLSEKLPNVLSQNKLAYAYITPSVITVLLIIFIPFIYSIGLGFFRELYNQYYFGGFHNFYKILFDFRIQPRAFYYTLGITIIWTAFNIFFHTSIGLGLALILKNKKLKFKGVYRSLLILPWAVPSYITALIWKGMFNKENGLINQALSVFSIEPIAWFNSTVTAFIANLVTNTWLGFPFMMVIAIGALQSIPDDLYEAAEIDGATAWDKFKNITIPLLKPAMFPAIILGTIWTFNMFNVIYLVSQGAPNNSTDILIVEAYRWAFENDLYAYASAYSMIIFLILLAYSSITNKLSKGTEGV